MATYYWVGGSGTWDSTTTTHWATSSGGTGGAGVPTSADSVVFDSASNPTSYTVTIANGTGSIYPKCFNLTVSGPASGNVTLSVSGQPVIYGSMTLAATGVIFTNGLIYFAATTPITITTNGVSLSSTIIITGYDISATYVSGGTYTLGSALVCGNLYSDGGTFDTSSSNYSITTGTLDQTSSLSPTIKLNASTVNISNAININNGSVNAGTSTINFTGASGSYSLKFGGQTYYNVTLNSGNYNNTTYSITDTATNTFNSFTYNASATVPSLNSLLLSGNISTTNLTLNAINGTFNNRIFVKSNTIGTQRTITWSNGLNVNYCDFRDINSSIISGNNGDCGGNSNMTFATPKTVFWNLAGSQNWSAVGWATSSGGTPAAANFPLAQDNVYFDNTGSAGTVTIDNNWNIGSLVMSGRTSAMTLATGTTTPTIYGSSWYYGTGVTTTGTGAITVSRGTRINYVYLYTNGVTLTQPIIVDSPNSGLSILNTNATITNSVTLNQGTLDLANLTLTCNRFSSNNSNTRTIAFGTGNITIPTQSSATVDLGNATGLTITGTPVINLTSSASGGNYWLGMPNPGLGATSAHAISVNVTAGSGSLILDNGGNAILGNINLTGSSYNWQILNGITTYGSVTLSATTTTTIVSNSLTFAATSGTQTITTNGVTVNFPIVASGSGTFQTSSALTSSSTLTIGGTTAYSPNGNVTVSTFTYSSTGQWKNFGLLTITGSGTSFNVTSNVSLFDNGGYISMTSASPKTFVGNSQILPPLNQGGSGTLTITGNNTFSDFINKTRGLSNSVSPCTILITAGSTQTINYGLMSLNGTAGNLVTLGSTSTSAFTITKSNTTGVNTCTFCSVSYMTGTTTVVGGGSVLWRFLNSTNGGNNTNLTFASQYYWVGGSGTWDATTTTNWSLTSGGAGAHGPPTANDDVVFDANSNATAYTVTMGTNGVCWNMTMSGPATGQVTWAGTTGVTISGNLFLSGTAANGGVVATISGYINLNTSYSATVTTNGVNFINTANLQIVGTGTVSLGSALNLFYNLTAYSGTFNTNGYAMTLGLFSSAASTVNFSSSTITVTGWFGGVWSVSSSTTLNAGTSSIIFGSGAIFAGGGKTYYNVTWNTTATAGSQFINDVNTFNTLTFNNVSVNGWVSLGFSANQTINTLVAGAPSITQRVFFFSSTSNSIYTTPGYAALPSTPTTLTVTSATLPNCDFRDIKFATPVNLSSQSAGDCGGNANITFPAAKTVYWNLAGTQNWSATGWATSSGGTPAVANFPLAQDTVIFDDAGALSSISIDSYYNIGTVNMGPRTLSMTLTVPTDYLNIYGNWTNGPGTGFSGTGSLLFAKHSGVQTLNANGVATPGVIVSNNYLAGASLALLSPLTCTGTFNIRQGTLTLNDYSINFPGNSSTFTSTNVYGPSTGMYSKINWGTGSINMGGQGQFSLDSGGSSVGYTSTGTPTVNMTYSGSTGTRYVYARVNSAYAPNINITAGSDIVNINLNSSYYNNLNFTGFTGSVAAATNALYITGNLTLGTGMTFSGFTGTTSFIATTGTQTLTTNGVSIAAPITVPNGATFATSGTLTSSSSFTTASTSPVTFGAPATFSNMALGSTGTVTWPTQITLTGSGSCFTDTAAHSGSYSGSSKISLTSATAKTFSGYSTNSYPPLSQDGAGALTVTTGSGTGSLNFSDLAGTGSFTNTVSPATILFTGGLTITVNKLNLNGTSGNLITLGSTNTTPVTLQAGSSVASTSTFCSVSYISASTSGGTVIWRFLNSTNGGNNTNLTFASQYYWVGGTGTWDNTNTANWSLTSGGAGAHGPPTANDDVVFDANSNATAYTVTVSVTAVNCFNMTVSGPPSGQVTLATNGGAYFNIYGSQTFSSNAANGGVALTSTNSINQYFKGVYNNHTVTTNGVTIAGGIYFSGTGTYTLGSALTVAQQLQFQGGTVTTSTNSYSITGGSGGLNGGTLILNASTFTLSGASGFSSGTLNAGTSTIVFSNTLFSNSISASYTFYNLTFLNCNSSFGASTISASCTFNNLTITTLTRAFAITITAGTTQTVRQILVNGTATYPVTLASSTTAPYTFTASTQILQNFEYCSVSYMTGTATAVDGGSVTWRFGHSTDGGNNTNLTFANTYYWVGGSGTWDTTTTTNWSLTSGGTGSAGVPTVNDNVVFDANSNATSYTVSGTRSSCFDITVAGPASGTVSMQPLTMNVYGNITLAATGISSTFGYYGGLSNEIPVTVTTNGVYLWPSQCSFSPSHSTINLGSALTTSYLYLPSSSNNSIFNTNDYAITAVLLSASAVTTSPTLNLGSSTITISGYPSSSTYTIYITPANRINSGISTINFTGGYNQAQFLLSLGGKTYYNFSLNTSAGTDNAYQITDTQTNTFNTFTFNAAASGGVSVSSASKLLLSGNIQSLNYYLNTISGSGTSVSSNSRLTVGVGNGAQWGDAFGTPVSLLSTGSGTWVAKSIDFRDITSAVDVAAGGASFGNCGGNTGLTFPAAKNVYWNNATGGGWYDPYWATVSGGAVSANNQPLAQDTAIIGNTGLNSGQTIVIGDKYNGTNISTIDASSRTLPWSLGNSFGGSVFVGNIKLTSAAAGLTSGNKFYVYGPAPQTISAPGVSFGYTLDIYNNLQLQSAFTPTTSLYNSISLYRGMLDLNGYTITGTFFYSTGSSTKFIGFNSGGRPSTMTLSGGDYIVGAVNYTTVNCSGASNLSSVGTGIIALTSATAHTFQGGGLTWPTLSQSGTGYLIIVGNNTFDNITNTVQPATVTFAAGSTQTVSAFNLNGKAGNLVTLNSFVPGTTFTLSKASGKVAASYLSLQDSTVTGGAKWYAGSTSTNVSNNLGWLFITPANPFSINSAGILSIPNVFDETQALTNSGKSVAERITSSSYQISGILDETQTLTNSGKSVAKRIDKNGNLFVSGYLDEFNPQ